MGDPKELAAWTDFKASIKGIHKEDETRHAEVAGHAEAIRTTLDGLTAALASAKNSAESHCAFLDERIQGVERALEEGVGDDAALTERISELEELMAAQEAVTATAKKTAAALGKERDEAWAAAESAGQRVTELEASLAASESERGPLEAKVRSLEESEEGMREDLNAAHAKTQAAAEAAEKAEAELAQLRGEADSLRGANAQREEAAKKLDTELAGLREELARVNETLAAKESAYSEIEARLTAAPTPEHVAELEQARGQAEERALAAENALTEERASGAKSVLAEQLAQALREAQQAQEALATAEAELAASKQSAPAMPPQEFEVPAEAPQALALEPEPEPQPELEPVSAPAPEPESDLPDEERVLASAQRLGSGKKLLMGDILAEARIVTAGQLEEAVEEQQRTPTHHIGAILIARGFASEEAVAQALACQSRVDFVRLSEDSVDAAAASLVSERLARQHACIPLTATEESIHLAMANPMDLVAIEDIERASNRKVEPLVATATDIEDAIARYYWEPE